jgi:hypothetical protein
MLLSDLRELGSSSIMVRPLSQPQATEAYMSLVDQPRKAHLQTEREKKLCMLRIRGAIERREESRSRQASNIARQR